MPPAFRHAEHDDYTGRGKRRQRTVNRFKWLKKSLDFYTDVHYTAKLETMCSLAVLWQPNKLKRNPIDWGRGGRWDLHVGRFPRNRYSSLGATRLRDCRPCRIPAVVRGSPDPAPYRPQVAVGWQGQETLP